jgi:hypothetical protein
MVRRRTGRGLFRASLAVLLGAAAAGCKENLSVPPPGAGPDVTGPSLAVRPARDTTVDSLGTLTVRVAASDRSNIKELGVVLIGASFVLDAVNPSDTVAFAQFPIALGTLKHSRFRYYARAKDILDYETVTDSVTVTVR